MTSDWLVELVRPPSDGGQHAGTPNYPVRVTHLPTGLVATVGTERSQHKNKQIAHSMIEWGLACMGIELKQEDRQC